MNRVDFISQLERLLTDIPESDRQDAIAYYNDYFEEAGAENEARVIQELGSPGRVAAMIKADLRTGGNEHDMPADKGQTPKQKRNLPWVLIIVLLIFASPILIGVGGGALGTVIGIIAGVVGIIFAILVCGVVFVIVGAACIILGVIKALANPVEGLIVIAAGSLLLALGLLLTVLLMWCVFKWIPALFRMIVNWCQRLFHRGERRSRV